MVTADIFNPKCSPSSKKQCHNFFPSLKPCIQFKFSYFTSLIKAGNLKNAEELSHFPHSSLIFYFATSGIRTHALYSHTHVPNQLCYSQGTWVYDEHPYEKGILQKMVNLLAAQKQVLRECLTTEGSIIFHKGEQKILNSLCADLQCGPSFTTYE